MFQLINLLALTAPSVLAQGIGGESATLHSLNNGLAFEQLGASVAGAGDVNQDGFADLIVGCVGANAAYVYSGLDGTVLYQFSDRLSSSPYFSRVANAGDVNKDGIDDLIVGTPFVYFTGIGTIGEVFVFSGADGVLLHRWTGNIPYGSFGYSVAGAGDINQDGYADIIIGAPTENPGGLHSAGSAYVYSGQSGQLLFRWDGMATEGRLGNSVAGAGDINQDGSDDLVIGVPSSWSGNTPGFATLFSGADGSQIYHFDGEENRDQFGFSVSGARDLNGDGSPDLIIGATETATGNYRRTGSAYAYSGIDGSLLHKWNGEFSGDRFGSTVSGTGDLDGDGFGDVLIGAPTVIPGNPRGLSSAYAYSGIDGALIHRWDGKTREDGFASSVSGAGDVNGDGFPDIIIGAPSETPRNLTKVGAAYVYSFHPFLRTDTPTLSASGGGSLSLDLSFPESASFYKYRVLISASGTGPTNYGVPIPLTQDSLFIDTYFGNYPMPNYSDLHGTLNATGDATASLTLPAGMQSLIGRTFYLAAIANPTGQLPEYSSIAVPLTITP
jgi:FG-GAP repeat protein/VCBS repeat protein